MPRERKYLPQKPGKENLLIKQRGAKGIGDALAGMKGGEARTGFLGDGNIVRKPDYMPKPENLDASELALKKTIQKLLISVIQPNPLSSKSTTEMDKRSLVNKLNRSSLVQLKGFLPSRIKRMPVEKVQQILDGTAAIEEEEKVEIQTFYMNISP